MTHSIPHHSIFQDLFVLELANNHWGQLPRGLKIINDYADVVDAHGVKAAVKLQFRDVDSFVHPTHRHRTDMRYIKKTIDTRMPWTNHQAMVNAVHARGMIRMVTPFDEISVKKCVEFGVEILKIASSDVRDYRLLECMMATGLPTIASTGGASLEDIDHLVERFTRRGIPFALNHCVSLYPSEASELELNQIDFLRNRYPHITIGFSSHEYGDITASTLMAYAKGARTFERHIDIDADGIAVSPYCITPDRAETWFKAFHTAKSMCGGPSHVKRTIPERERVYLDALVRGVYAKRDLPSGHMITPDDVYLAIPLQHGQASVREPVVGQILNTAVKADGIIDYAALGHEAERDPALTAQIATRGQPRLAVQDTGPARAAV